MGHELTRIYTDLKGCEEAAAMDIDATILFKDISYRIIGLAMQVHKELGPGFLEKVYENAMMVLFRREGIEAVRQMPIMVSFLGVSVGGVLC